jgi:valyl-tRNA synthetase
VYASRSDLTVCPTCGSKEIAQETDVLDTWFSSWLWPFATFGWPFRAPMIAAPTPEAPRSEDFDIQRADLAYFYPTNMLATASEILFFWVARMIMAGLHFNGKIPFSDVYIHGTVRDDKGVKMSKSLGNTIDPIEIIEKFGADSLRFSLMMLCATGSDVYLNDEKFLLGRNFCNKIWNATKFTLSNIDMTQVKDSLDGLELTDADRWMLAETDRLIVKATDALEKYRINEYVKDTYDFFWTKFCDWYVEIAKVEKNAAKATVMIRVLRTVMKILHPVMPFITDEIYSMIKPACGCESVVVAKWPTSLGFEKTDDAAFAKLQDLVFVIRSFKKDLGIADKIEIAIEGSDAAKKAAEANKAWICLTARISDIKLGKFAEGCAENATLDYTIYVKKEGIAGLDEVKIKIAKRKKELFGFIAGGEKKLENRAFVDKAPPAIIDGAKAQIAQNKAELAQLEKIKFD